MSPKCYQVFTLHQLFLDHWGNGSKQDDSHLVSGTCILVRGKGQDVIHAMKEISLVMVQRTTAKCVPIGRRCYLGCVTKKGLPRSNPWLETWWEGVTHINFWVKRERADAKISGFMAFTCWKKGRNPRLEYSEQRESWCQVKLGEDGKSQLMEGLWGHCKEFDFF